jgi:iron(III) transport system permease protein
LPNASSPIHRAAIGPVTFWARLDGWTLTAIVIAALVAIPVVVVMASLLVPAGEVWRHLADTVLTGYVVNTLVLMLGVGAGTLVIGIATAWLVTMCRFPGHGVFEWALLLPLAVPTYAIAFTYGGLFEFAGPVQTELREVFGWGRSDYWFPEVRSLGGAILVMSVVLYPYVSVGPGRLSRAIGLCHGSQPHFRTRALAQLPGSRLAAGSAGHRRRRGPGADGSPE